MKYSPIFSFALFKLILLIYIKSVWCKITRLALVGYNYTSAYSPLRAFMRKISMLLNSMVKLERDIFGCAGLLCTCRPTLFSFATLTWS